MKKIKAVEIVLFACLLASCFIVPRFLTAHLLSGITTHRSPTTAEKETRDLMKKYNLATKPGPIFGLDAVFPEGGWFEQLVRVGLIGLMVFYAFRVAKRIDRESLPPIGEDKGS